MSVCVVVVMVRVFTTISICFFAGNGPHNLYHDHFFPFSSPKWSSSALSRPLLSFFTPKMVLIHFITTTSLCFFSQNGPHTLYHDRFSPFSLPKCSSSALSRPLSFLVSLKMVLIPPPYPKSLSAKNKSAGRPLIYEKTGRLRSEIKETRFVT
mgnify:CR=1 FL=1